MTPEAYCAQMLSTFEGEEFLAVGDEVAKKLNTDYDRDRQAGRAASLPDLLSYKREAAAFRLREVKFKLQEAIVLKALEQLKSGARHLEDTRHSPQIDRLEIVVPLKNRKLKAEEKPFLGKPLPDGRYRLNLKGAPVTLRIRGKRYAVTVMVL